MKILLTNHIPFHDSEAGGYTRDLAAGLLAAGHEVECLIVDAYREPTEDFNEGFTGEFTEEFTVERIVCGSAADTDLPFELPCFTTHPRSDNTFHQLTDKQYDAYREVTRARLDKIIARFHPDMVHCQHIWLQAYLTLESGAPYIITTHGAELAAYRADPRFRASANQAAENAGRILAASDTIRSETIATFDVAPERVVTVHNAIDKLGQSTESPAFARSSGANSNNDNWIGQIVEIYRLVLAERFGRHPTD